MELQLDSQRVSKTHAAIVEDGDGFAIEDLESRNGTFVNGHRVGKRTPLGHGDLVHIGGHDLRFLMPAMARKRRRGRTMTLTVEDGRPSPVLGLPEFLEALQGRGVHTVFQPLFELTGGACVGYEALTRTTTEATGPSALFELAERHRRAAALSRALRRVALSAARGLPPGDSALLFLNVHPDEMGELAADLETFAAAVPPGQTAVLELHESAVTDDVRAMRAIRDELHRVGMFLAYDDVGAGRSRLREIADAPPDFVKLDRSLVTGIERSEPRQQLLRGLLKATGDLGIRVVAEGIETREEYQACAELGIELAQGYYLAQPRTASSFDTPTVADGA